jgi:peptide/nickel transport system substrate-binding protein
MKGSAVAAGLLAASLALSTAGARAAGDEMPSDPKAFVEWVRKGNLPPIAPWKRYTGKIQAPPFGAEPPLDPHNPLPAGKESWLTPADGGTLVVQYNSAPKNINKILSNDAIVEYVTNTVRPYLIQHHMVKFTYGEPSKDDPAYVFDSVNPSDCASRFVKEDTLLRADGSVAAYGAVTAAGDAWDVRPVAAPVEGEEKRKAVLVPRKDGDRVLRGTFCTVYLKPGVKWHDGAPFRAQDVAFSVKVINNPDVNSDNVKPYFELVKSCEALDDLTIRWILDRQYFGADDTIVGANQVNLPLHAYEAAFKASKEGAGKPFDPSSQAFAQFFNNYTPLNEKPLGTGPYRVVDFKAAQSVFLERNPHFHGPRPHADRIVWKFISDPVAALQALQSGEVDFVAHGPTEDQYMTVMAEPRFKSGFARAAWFTPAMAFVALNRRSPVLADARVRAALAMLADRPGFVSKKLHDLAVLVSGDEFIAGPAYDPEVKPIAYDPAAAGELLDEAGWYDRDGDGIRDKDGKPLEFEFLYSTGSKTMKEFAPLWLEACKKEGVRLKPADMEWAMFIEKFEGKKFDAITLQWAMDPENDPHQLWHSKWAAEGMKSSNTTSYADPRADALIEAIQECLEPKERFRYHFALHRLLDADAGYVFLFARPEIGAYARKWRGVRHYPKRPGFNLTEWYVPKELQEAGGK